MRCAYLCQGYLIQARVNVNTKRGICKVRITIGLMINDLYLNICSMIVVNRLPLFFLIVDVNSKLTLLTIKLNTDSKLRIKGKIK